MRLRSLLFVPGDRPERMVKARGLGADALILDLEDSVAPAGKAAARAHVAAALAEPRTVPLFVRINPLDSGLADDDLAAVLAGKPDGIVLPKAEGAASLAALDARLSGDTVILPIATETPAAIFMLGSYGGVTDRLVGLTWGAEDLPAAIGAATSREADGSYTAPYQLARSLTLFGAHAARVAAIETVYPDFRDLDGLAAYAARGRRDGFTGMMAIHPSQVAVINAAFTPSAEDRAKAQAIVDLFAANPGAGALQIEGRMVDAPHLKAAKAVLALAAD
ncbi:MULTISPECIES: HpcH/HpaI aldolase/citrate lyase family protein [unclassified Sphingomonas]|uniref:HpcH/HpaI aldolase/citrate lyase family protein n=1 Tax=unclassified Sphingomonas TaxID=196159 RepID=UPI0006F735BC|nr:MULTISPECIES: CoA ester lyase [unclassified Sphingomonas]KQN30041.1 citrate lyase [Sphingomonas sp. Leaf38]KQN32269.1 citrate lyase [Sphingomonas sp. Leaf34]